MVVAIGVDVFGPGNIFKREYHGPTQFREFIGSNIYFLLVKTLMSLCSSKYSLHLLILPIHFVS